MKKVLSILLMVGGVVLVNIGEDNFLIVGGAFIGLSVGMIWDEIEKLKKE